MQKLLTTIIAALLLAGCTYRQPEPEGEDQGHYFGLLTDINDSETFTMDNVEASVTRAETDSSYTIKLYRVKFATAMPVKLDIVIPGVAIDSDGHISGDNIVPYAMGGAYDKYTIRDLTGSRTDSTLSLAMTIGSYPTTYEGRR